MGKIIKPRLSDRIDPFNPIAKKLVSAWFLNERGGVIAHDIRNKFNATMDANAPRWIPEGLNFDSGVEFLSAPHNSLFNVGTKGITVTAKVRCTSAESMYVVNKNYGGGGVKWWALQVQNQANFYMDDGTTAVFAHGTSLINYPKKWHTITGVRDDNGNLYIYVDGIDETETPVSQSNDCDSSNGIVIGGRYDESVARDFIGDIEYVMVFNEALTPNEVRALYIDPSLIIYKPKPAYCVVTAGGITGSGNLTTGNVQANGSGVVERSGSGNLTTGQPQANGAGAVGRQGSGDLTTGLAQMSGTGTVTSGVTGSGNLTVGNVQADGSGTRGAAGTGGLTTGLPQADGAGKRGATGSGNLTTGTVKADGSGAVSGAVVGSGDLTVGNVQASGSGTRGAVGSGNLTVGNVQADGSGSVEGAVVGSGNLTVGNVQASGTGTRKAVGSGNLRLSITRISGTGKRVITGSGNLTISVVQVSGTGSAGNEGTGNLTTGSVQISGTGTVGRVGLGDLTIGQPQTDGAGTLGRSGSGNLRIGNVYMTGTGIGGGYISGEGNLTVGLPRINGVEATQTPIILRIVNKMKGLLENMTQANGYSLDYSDIDTIDPSSKTYPVVHINYPTEEASEFEVFEWESVETTLEIRVELDSTADLDKSAHYVAADFGYFMESYRASFLNQGLIDFNLLRSNAEYKSVTDHAIEVSVELGLKYRRNLESPFLVDFSTTNSTPSYSAFDSGSKPIAIAIIDQIKTLIPAMTTGNGYTTDYGSVNVVDPDSKTFPVTNLSHPEEIYQEQEMVGYYEAETPINFNVTCDTTVNLDLLSRRVLSDFTKFFRSNFASLQTKGLSRFEYQQAEFSYKMVNDYAVMVSLTYSIFYRRRMDSPYTT